MKLFSIILSSLSLIVVVATIVFEGKFKIERKEKFNLKNFKKEFKKLSPYGWFLLILLIVLSFGNGIVSYKNIEDYERQYEEDTTKFNNLLNLSYKDTLRLSGIIKELKEKRENDSITISFLLDLTKVNGLKSDSIKIQVVDNAVKAIDEQRKIIQRSNNNAFLNLYNELLDNIIVINKHYTEEKVMVFIDSSAFLANQLTNESLNRYILISNNNDVIDFLKETSLSIDNIQKDIHSVLIHGKKEDKEKKMVFIKQFLVSVRKTKIRISYLLEKTYKLSSYNQFENLKINSENSNEIHYKIIDSLITDYGQRRRYKIYN